MVRTFLTLSENGNPNTDVVGVEATRQGGTWVIHQMYQTGPAPRVQVDPRKLSDAEMARVLNFLDGQEELDSKNAETSRQEVEAFRNGSGAVKYFAYLNVEKRAVTTYMGDTLAELVWLGDAYKCPAFGRPQGRAGNSLRPDGPSDREGRHHARRSRGRCRLMLDNGVGA